MRNMLRTYEGKYIKGNGLKTIQAVKSQFKKAGHEPGTVADLEISLPGGSAVAVYSWACSCGAKLQFEKRGRRFFRLSVIGGPV